MRLITFGIHLSEGKGKKKETEEYKFAEHFPLGRASREIS
jgi:hypothetical protein